MHRHCVFSIFLNISKNPNIQYSVINYNLYWFLVGSPIDYVIDCSGIIIYYKSWAHLVVGGSREALPRN